MIIVKITLLILMALPLTSFAPVPAQQCSEADARQFGTVLRQIVYDPQGIPYGEVKAWSCTGDTTGAIAELRERQSKLEGEAAAYRAANPLRSTR